MNLKKSISPLKRGDKIYLDSGCKVESAVNHYLSCRDGIVECYEYTDSSGHGAKTRLFLCRDTKHETICIVRQVLSDVSGRWIEECMDFDADSYMFLAAIIDGKVNQKGGTYCLVRYY